MSRLLDTRRGRLTTFFLLYISEGIPLGFTLVTMGTYMRQRGVSLADIGAFTAAMYGPWGFKWAWAPLIDLVRPKRFGPHRTWIVSMQALMTLTLATPLFFDFTANVPLLIVLMIVHNVFASTQDVAIDALAVRVVPKDELGTANGFMFAGASVGQALGGGASLFAAGFFGFRASFLLTLGILVGLLVFVSLRLDEPPDEEDLEVPADLVGADGAPAPARVVLGFLGRLWAFLRELYNGFFRFGWAPLVGVLLALAPKGALALGLTVGITMRVDIGLTDNQIATLSVVSSLFGALGCVAGGWISDRVGHRRALVAWFALTTLPNLYLMSHLGNNGVVGLTLTVFAIASIAASLTNGLQYGTSNAVFMSVTNKKVAATQFTGYMALSNLANTYTAFWQGRYAQSSGYRRTLGLDALIAVVPMILVCLIRPRPEQEEGGAGGPVVEDPAPVR